MNRLAIAFKHSFVPFLVVLICVVLFVFEPASSDKLAYIRESVATGEIWRLVTGNLVHTNANHLLLNLTGLLLLWAIHGFYYSIRGYILLFLFFSIMVTSNIYLINPEMLWYAGLSGVLHGFFVWGAFQDIKHKVKFGWLLMVGVWLKVAYEQVFGQDQNLANFIDANVAINSHLYGSLAGVIAIIFLAVIHKLPKE